MVNKKIILTEEYISQQIFAVRGEKVMLDSDLAKIYGVETRVLNQAVKRNRRRFPSDFIFQLTAKEFANLTSQNVTSSGKAETGTWGGRRKMPYVFTEHGAVMLASVLNSEVAVEASIRVVRAFVKFREVVETHKQLAEKFQLLETKLGKHDKEIQMLFEAIRQLMQPVNEPRKKIGYKRGAEDDRD